MRRAVIVASILFLLGQSFMKQGITSDCVAGLSINGAMTTRHVLGGHASCERHLFGRVRSLGWMVGLDVVNGLYLYPHVFLLYYHGTSTPSSSLKRNVPMKGSLATVSRWIECRNFAN